MHKIEKHGEIHKKIKKLIDEMIFNTFENNKKYSFSYEKKRDFDTLIKESKQSLGLDKGKNLPLTINGSIPIFLPKETTRIAFFHSTSKSVRRIPSHNVINALRKKRYSYDISKDDPRNIDTILKDDISKFKAHLDSYEQDEYFIDTFSDAIRFNAYDEEDNLLLEKSYVRGGLVFDIKEDAFYKTVSITYPRHRKKRKDSINDYLGLTLLKIRPIPTHT